MTEQDYGSLSDDDLCVVNALLYNDKVYDQMRESCQAGNNVTLYELLNGLESQDGGSFDEESLASVHTTSADWDLLVEGVLADEHSALSSLEVYDFDADERLGSRSVCLRDEEGVPYVVFRGTGTDEDGTEWYDNALGLSMPNTSQQIGACAFAEYIAQETGCDVVVSGHSKGGNKAMYTAITSDCVARCVAFDGQGFGSDFMDEYSERISERSGLIRNYYAEGDFVSPLLNSVAGECICIKPSNLQGDYARNHVVNCLLTDDLKLGEQGERSAAAQQIGEFTTWLDNNVSSSDRKTIGTFLAEVLSATMGEGNLVETLQNNPEGLGCLLAYVSSYPDSDDLINDLLYEVMDTALGDGEAMQPAKALLSMLHDNTLGTADAAKWVSVLLGLELLQLSGSSGIVATIWGTSLAQQVLTLLGFDVSYFNKVKNAYTSARASIGSGSGTASGAAGSASMRVHDLTIDSLWTTLSSIDAVTNQRMYDGSRWDAWDRVNRALGGLGIFEHRDEITRRYNTLAEDIDETKEGVKRMYVSAWFQDDQFAQSVNQVNGDVQNLRMRLEALATSM